VLGVCSSRQLVHWRDSIALFSRAVAVTRDNHLAHYNLGTALGQAGRIEEALAQQEVAQQIMLRAEVARQKKRTGGS
jgi:tetratricopeptide (TPR) repeat protein